MASLTQHEKKKKNSSRDLTSFEETVVVYGQRTFRVGGYSDEQYIRSALYLSRYSSSSSIMTSMMCALYTTNNKRKWTIARACPFVEKKRLGIAVRNWKPPSVKSHITFTTVYCADDFFFFFFFLLSLFYTYIYTDWKKDCKGVFFMANFPCI